MGQNVPAGGRLSRQQAATLAGVSVATIRRWEAAGLLVADIDAKGVHSFDREQVETVAREHARKNGPEATTGKLQETLQDQKVGQSGLDENSLGYGQIAAKAFVFFGQNKTPVEAVVELQVPPLIVQDLHRHWLNMRGSTIITGDERLDIEQTIGMKISPKHLPKLVILLADAYKKFLVFKYDCCRCGQPIWLDQAAWKAVLDSGVLSNWAHKKCPPGE